MKQTLAWTKITNSTNKLQRRFAKNIICGRCLEVLIFFIWNIQPECTLATIRKLYKINGANKIVQLNLERKTTMIGIKKVCQENIRNTHLIMSEIGICDKGFI